MEDDQIQAIIGWIMICGMIIGFIYLIFFGFWIGTILIVIFVLLPFWIELAAKFYHYLILPFR